MKLKIFAISLFIGLSASAQSSSDVQDSKKQNSSVIEPSPESDKTNETEKPFKQIEGEETWKFALGLGFSLAPKLTFKSSTYTSAGSTTTFSADLDYKGALSLDLQGRYLPKNSWGMTAGLQSDSEQEFDKGSIAINGATVGLTGGSGSSKIQVLNIYGNAVYRWESFYLPFGLNISSVKFTPAAGSTGTTDASGGIGAQLGVGVFVAENWCFEMFSRSISVKLKTTTSSSVTDYGNGYLSSLLLQGKYIF